MNTPQQQLEPATRAARAGYTWKFSYVQAGKAYRICIVRDGVPLACRTAGRTGSLNLAQATERARTGAWGPTSGVYKAMVELCDVVESTLLDPAKFSSMCERVRETAVAAKSLR